MELKQFYKDHSTKIVIAIGVVVVITCGIMGYYRNKTEYLEPVSEDEVREAFGEVGWGQSALRDPEALGKTFRPINFKTSLAERLTEGGAETTIDVSSVTTIDDHTLVMTDIGDIVYLMINPGASNWELVSCTTLTTTQFGGCTRGYISYANSTATARIKAHSPGESVIITNDDHYLSTQYVRTDEASVFSGQPRFENASGFIVGPESALDSILYAGNTGPSASAYLAFDPNASTTGAWVFSNDGSDSFLIGGADSQLYGDQGISMSGSAVNVLLATTTPGLHFNNDGLRVLLDPSELLLALSANGLGTVLDRDLFTASSTENLMYSFLTAGETIDATTASPTAIVVDSSGDIYKAQNGFASTSQNFVGFAVSSGAVGSSIKVKQSSVIDGFTGLTPASLYYLTYGTAGEISSATSTVGGPIIGRAISTTKLNIQLLPTNWITGENLVVASTSAESDARNETAYTKYESFRVGNSGAITVSFDMYINDNAYTAYGRIYVNGVAVGTEHSTTSESWVNFTDDISVGIGDEVGLYVKIAPAGSHLHCSDFMIMAGNLGLSYASST